MTPYDTIRSASVRAAARTIQTMHLIERMVAINESALRGEAQSLAWAPRNAHIELIDIHTTNMLLPYVDRGIFAENDDEFLPLQPDGDQA